jgi:hypothetical protein
MLLASAIDHEAVQVFFLTQNGHGRKLEDAFNSYDLFPTIRADGPCSLHVNLGQGGFIFIEANVKKKWGLAPSVTYGSERGSTLLKVGAGSRVSPLILSCPLCPLTA